MEWPYTILPGVTYGVGANTLNVNVTAFYSGGVIREVFMHLKCWRLSGAKGRWIKHPGYPVKCHRCGRTIAQRAEAA